MYLKGLSTSLVRCFTICTDGHLATLQTILIQGSDCSSPSLSTICQPEPSHWQSLCLAVNSARTAVGRSTTLARQSGTRCRMN